MKEARERAGTYCAFLSASRPYVKSRIGIARLIVPRPVLLPPLAVPRSRPSIIATDRLSGHLYWADFGRRKRSVLVWMRRTPDSKWIVIR
jgi:hypothetical protein